MHINTRNLRPFPQPSYSRDFRRDVNSWLCSAAFWCICGSMHDTDGLPEVEALADAVYALAAKHGDHLVCEYDVQGRPGRFEATYEWVEKAAASAAKFALEEFDIDRWRMWQQGGKTSRRGPSFTLDQYALVVSLSASLQQAALGCSRSTIKSLRRRWREQS